MWLLLLGGCFSVSPPAIDIQSVNGVACSDGIMPTGVVDGCIVSFDAAQSDGRVVLEFRVDLVNSTASDLPAELGIGLRDAADRHIGSISRQVVARPGPSVIEGSDSVSLSSAADVASLVVYVR
jgi:hypothetical protein